MSINCYFKCVNKGWKKSSDQIGTIYCAQFWRGNESSTRQTCPVLSCPGSGPSSAKHLKSGSKEVAKWSTRQVRKSRPQNPIHPNHDSANVSLSVSSCLWPLLSRMNPPKGNTDIFFWSGVVTKQLMFDCISRLPLRIFFFLSPPFRSTAWNRVSVSSRGLAFGNAG